jgi:nitrite reductase/ring-hydroxylating ferredoxin subunit
VVIATHVPLQGVTGTLKAALFQSKLAAYTSYAIGAKAPPGLVPVASYWDTAEPYHYLRVDQRRTHDYVIFGGADHKTGQSADPAKHFADLERKLFGILPDAKIDHRWSGQVIETNDGLPFIGETAPRQFLATGFAGNGMTFGTLGAMMARDHILGRRNPWQDLFHVHRKKLRGGTWDYLKENKDYPYYYLKDRLITPEAKSLRAIKQGDGKIVMVNGQRAAVSRDADGKLTIRAAACTHMGCIVRWNEAEKTWDCPCHGSRFHPSGKVMAGPAETDLSEASRK